MKWRKAALALSACLFVLWWALGTGATLAWFTDVEEVRNEFHIGQLDLDVSYKNDLVKDYTQLDGADRVFYDDALYEPGYTQVVYLKIESDGDVDFNYKIAVTVEGWSIGTSVLGNSIYLPDYLNYGVVFAKTEAELSQLLADRLQARNESDAFWGRLDTWSENSPYAFDVKNDDAHYAALIVYMPEEIGNAANYRGITQPKVELGVTVFAQQANADLN